MLLSFLLTLRAAGLKVSLSEFLALLELLARGFPVYSLPDFYQVARLSLIKDETQYDRFDAAFAAYFKGVEAITGEQLGSVPEAWLQQQLMRLLSDEERARIRSLGGFEQLIDTLRQRLQEQTEAHHGGNKWIGTAGTSPFGHSGIHPEGIRIGGEGRNRRAVKVWERREFRNLDDRQTLGTRHLQLALRRLRRFARQGAAQELDLAGTIAATARNAGQLQLQMVAERHNSTRLLLLMDVGGSMDPHVRLCEPLFSACRSEFKHLEYYYFHNCIYESLWKDNARRHEQRVATIDVLHRYTADYKVIIIGDAMMSPYEIVERGGSVEHWNEEPGQQWIERLTASFPHLAWLNPEPEHAWSHASSVGILRTLIGPQRMHPLTLDGLDAAIRSLHH